MQTNVTQSEIKTRWIIMQFSTWQSFTLLGLIFLNFSSFSILGQLLELVIVIFFSIIFRIPSMVIWSIIIGALTAIFPPLGIIVTIIFFILKISYIFENFLGLLLGVFFFLSPMIYDHFSSNMNPDNILFKESMDLSAGLISIIIFVLISLISYGNGYSADRLFSVILTTPVFIFMLILPFLIDAIDDMFNLNTNQFNSYENEYLFNHATNTLSSEDNLNFHGVKGHWRQTPSGGYTWVDAHIRTNPDGITSNNFSSKS